MNWGSCVLVWIFSSLCRGHVVLVTQGFPSYQVALLEHNNCISKYEVNCTCNGRRECLGRHQYGNGFMMDWSAPTRRVTAWCFYGPAVFWNHMSWAINPSPTATAKPCILLLCLAIQNQCTQECISLFVETRSRNIVECAQFFQRSTGLVIHYVWILYISPEKSSW